MAMEFNMSFNSPVILILCWDEKIRDDVIGFINDTPELISIHLSESLYRRVSLSVIKEMLFDILIIDETFVQNNGFFKIRELIPSSEFLFVSGAGEPDKEPIIKSWAELSLFHDNITSVALDSRGNNLLSAINRILVKNVSIDSVNRHFINNERAVEDSQRVRRYRH